MADGEEHPHGERYRPALVSALALALSVAAFVFFYRRGDILLYGDAVAHLNLARRLSDARVPGWNQIGTVWLPLPHMLSAPFVASDALWRSGIGGSIVSMISYVLGVAGIFRLMRARASSTAAWLAAAIYGLNPSLLYLQSTAMTEPIFLAEMIWAVVYFDAFLRALGEDAAPRLPAWRALERCGFCLAAAAFTRYDGWMLAFVVGLCAAGAALRWYASHREHAGAWRLRRSLVSFLLLLALCPALWLAHNYRLSQRPLDWFNGPYSARAIAQRMPGAGTFLYPGERDPRVAALYYLKAARMNTGEGFAEYWLAWLALAGLGIAITQWRRFGAFVLLWLPLPFYIYSVAYGSVPIYVPVWSPFSYYNVRYGVELLPAFAVCVALIFVAARQIAERAREKTPHWLAPAVSGLLLAAILLAYGSSAAGASPRAREDAAPHRWMIPVSYRAALVNGRARAEMEARLARELSGISPDATVLMYAADHVGALQRAGLRFDRVISEFSPREWKAAMLRPVIAADYVVAVEEDPVAQAVSRHPHGLTRLVELHTEGKPPVAIYRSARHTPPANGR